MLEEYYHDCDNYIGSDKAHLAGSFGLDDSYYGY